MSLEEVKGRIKEVHIEFICISWNDDQQLEE